MFKKNKFLIVALQALFGCQSKNAYKQKTYKPKYSLIRANDFYTGHAKKLVGIYPHPLTTYAHARINGRYGYR